MAPPQQMAPRARDTLWAGVAESIFGEEQKNGPEHPHPLYRELNRR
jgi:hypothetical protein